MGCKIKFDHNKDTINEAIGISDDRAIELINVVQGMVERDMVVSKILEKIWSSDYKDPEKIFMTMILGFIAFSQNVNVADPGLFYQ